MTSNEWPLSGPKNNPKKEFWEGTPKEMHKIIYFAATLT